MKTDVTTALPLKKETPPPVDEAARQRNKLRQAARDFEAVFVQYLLRSMRRSVPKTDLFGRGLSGEFYESMFDQSVARAVVSKRGLGLADKIIEELERRLPEPASARATAGANADWVRKLVEPAARKHRVDARLVQAVIQVESSYRVDAVSPKGAVGLMQLMPETATEMGVRDRWNPVENIAGGVKYLRQLLDRFEGRVEWALAAYNAGPAAVERHGGVPPYAETRRYVKKVLQTYRDL